MVQVELSKRLVYPLKWIFSILFPLTHFNYHLNNRFNTINSTAASLHHNNSNNLKQKIMKNLKPTCNLFHSAMNHAAANSETSNSNLFKTHTFKRTILFFVCAATLLLTATSCSRGISSGCGTWPTVKVNKNQYRSDSWPMKAKSNHQFANYKKYN